MDVFVTLGALGGTGGGRSEGRATGVCGLLMTFADRACGMTARYVSGRPTLATVQLDVHFVDSGKIGEILLAKPRVVRATRSLVFMTTEVTAGNRCIVMANGVFKILKNEG